MIFGDVGSFGLQTTRDPEGQVTGVLPSITMLIMVEIIELVIIIDLGKDSDVSLQQYVLESSVRGKVTSLFAILA